MSGVSRYLGDYRLLGEVRRGGCAEVQRAVGPDGDEVALKIALDDADNGARLLREIATLASLSARDPALAEWSVVPLSSGVGPDARPWVAMRWYPHSLRSWVQTTAPSLPELVSALRQAATAVLRLQGTGDTPGTPRLHRDVKPDNFLVDAGNHRVRVVLADFGGSRADHLATTSRPTLHYTTRYGPAEQTLTRDAPPDPSLDAHALAVTMYWCLTGREPDSKGSVVAYTSDGRRLLDLQAATRLTEGEATELRRLRGVPLGQLLDFEEMVPLTAADEARLGATLEDELRRIGGDPSLVPTLIAPLVSALRRALHPDPERRDADLRKLVAATEVMEGTLRLAGLAAELPRVAPPSVEPAEPPVHLRVAGAPTGAWVPGLSTVPPPPPTAAGSPPAPPDAPIADEARTLDPAGIAFAVGAVVLAVLVVGWVASRAG